MKPEPKSLYDKLWESHLVTPETEQSPAVFYIDLHLIHEVTSPQAFDVLRERGLQVACPDRTVGTIDHSSPTLPKNADGSIPYTNDSARSQVEKLEANCKEFGIELNGWQSENRGIVHVIGPELGHTQPGKTIVCGDSHTSTHGAFGALAFGIGTTEVGHVLATQCILQRKSKSLSITVDGNLQQGVSAKDLVLAIIQKIGIGGGTGHVIEFRGNTIEALSMDERMTVCNMAIEAGARAGMIAPDATTFEWLKNRKHAPKGEAWEQAVADWRTLKSDEGASFDKYFELNADEIKPMVTYGTNPAMGVAIDENVPNADQKALDYMGMSAGQDMIGTKIDVSFIGSCTNSRLSDLEDAAKILKGRKVASHVRMLIVPGSQVIKKQAEALGLDKIFIGAGAEWRESGCSMCIAMYGDIVGAGQVAISTSNRNFEGRQGKGARTILASPLTAAASAVSGEIADPREYLNA
ncbi:MAG: 3-isopropylmalate dehydratase large subunit [Alphaproteobacteria bacterium]|nr:3-isopropylmalate dehydratase large subunit [Alphaproteobacteria bacterium]